MSVPVELHTNWHTWSELVVSFYSFPLKAIWYNKYNGLLFYMGKSENYFLSVDRGFFTMK